MICHAHGAHFDVVKRKRGRKKTVGPCAQTDWPHGLARKLLHCAWWVKGTVRWYACVQLHQGYFYLDPDGRSCRSFSHCTQRWPQTQAQRGVRTGRSCAFSLSCCTLLCVSLWGRTAHLDLYFPYDPRASKIMFPAGQHAIWSSLYFLFALHLDTGTSHLLFYFFYLFLRQMFLLDVQLCQHEVGMNAGSQISLISLVKNHSSLKTLTLKWNVQPFQIWGLWLYSISFLHRLMVNLVNGLHVLDLMEDVHLIKGQETHGNTKARGLYCLWNL